MAPSAPFAAAKRTFAMVASVLLPVQPKKIGMRGVFIFAVSTMICFFSSGASIDVSPVEPMISTADVPRSSWNFNKVRNAPKSTEPSLLNGVISATNEPVSILLDIPVSIFATFNPIDRSSLWRRQRSNPKPILRYLYDTEPRPPTAFCRDARPIGLLRDGEIGHPVAPSSERRPWVCCECSLRWPWPAQ